MKNIWKYILGIGAAIGGVLFFFLSPTGNKKQFKKDLKKSKKKVKHSLGYEGLKDGLEAGESVGLNKQTKSSKNDLILTGN